MILPPFSRAVVDLTAPLKSLLLHNVVASSPPSPTSPSLDVPMLTFNPYNHHHHSSFLTPLQAPSFITHIKENKVNNFSSQLYRDPIILSALTLTAKSFWEAYPHFVPSNRMV
jgi:hypothetical protein